jgi:small-conductance mechanosensitive channel
VSLASRLVLTGALVALAGVQAYSAWSQGERLEALEQQLESLRAEVRAANARAAAPATEVACAPAADTPVVPPVPPEAFAVRVVQFLEERQRARTQPAEEGAARAPPEQLTPQAQSTLARARQLAEAVLATKRMRAEEAAELRALLGAVGHTEEARAIRQRFIIASNRGELELPPGVLPYLP